MRLIDADALNFDEVVCDDIFCGICPFFIDDFCKLQSMINRTPTIDAVPVVHAHWVEDGYFGFPNVCSHCGSEWKKKTKRCPECGAVMDEVINDESD